MRFYVSTPIIRNLAQTFNQLDKKIAGNLAKADSFVKRHPALSYILGANKEDRDVAPFINEELIAITTKESIRITKKKGFGNSVEEYSDTTSSPVFAFDDKLTALLNQKASPFSSETYEVPAHHALDRRLESLFKRSPIGLQQTSR